MPTAMILSSEEVDFDALAIKFDGIEFDEQYKKVMTPDIEKAKGLYWCGEYIEAKGLFEKLADKGNAEAMLYIGLCYKFGRGVEPDEQRAFEWYKKSAEAGNSDAMNKTAICYRNGQGVIQDDNIAIKWYQKAADAGEMYAMSNLAWCYLNAIGGISKDNEKALYWYKKSAEAGYSYAIGRTAKMFFDRDELDKAEYWASIGSSNNDKLSVNIYICVYAKRGRYDKIVDLMKQRAEAGDIKAMISLGCIYANVLDIPYSHYKDIEKGKSLLIKAAEKAEEKGDVNECYSAYYRLSEAYVIPYYTFAAHRNPEHDKYLNKKTALEEKMASQGKSLGEFDGRYVAPSYGSEPWIFLHI